MNSAIFKIMPAAGGNFNAVNYNLRNICRIILPGILKSGILYFMQPAVARTKS
jgi:hypothetical protein